MSFWERQDPRFVISGKHSDDRLIGGNVPRMIPRRYFDKLLVGVINEALFVLVVAPQIPLTRRSLGHVVEGTAFYVCHFVDAVQIVQRFVDSRRRDIEVIVVVV